MFIQSPPWAVLKQWRAVHVQHCNKSMPRFSQLFPQKYCQDICNASCYLLSPVTAAFPASYWSPFKREHFGCWGVCISVCVHACGCLFLCLYGSLSDRASEECLSVFLYTEYIHDNSELFWDCKLEKRMAVSKVFFMKGHRLNHTLKKY